MRIFMILPVRGNFDLSDASQMQFEANERIKADKASKASQTAQDASGGVQIEKAGGNVPPPEKRLRKPLELRYIRPLDVYMAQ